MKVQANALKPGNIIEVETKLLTVTKVEHRTPGNLRAFVQVEAKDVASGNKKDFRFSSTEAVERVRIDEIAHQYLFAEGDQVTFMNNENYEQIVVDRDLIGEPAQFLQDGMQVQIAMHEGKPLGVTLPESVVMEIVEAEPVVKGQTASGGFKTAKLSNGARIMVPQYMASGEMVVVRTDDGSFIERAKN
ncbi:MAG: elongation factor P [Alphaproteobacteria bacterium]|nr:MAG: elongation factor P [Alphaproteobacteria bacterium]